MLIYYTYITIELYNHHSFFKSLVTHSLDTPTKTKPPSQERHNLNVQLLSIVAGCSLQAFACCSLEAFPTKAPRRIRVCFAKSSIVKRILLPHPFFPKNMSLHHTHNSPAFNLVLRATSSFQRSSFKKTLVSRSSSLI